MPSRRCYFHWKLLILRICHLTCTAFKKSGCMPAEDGVPLNGVRAPVDGAMLKPAIALDNRLVAYRNFPEVSTVMPPTEVPALNGEPPTAFRLPLFASMVKAEMVLSWMLDE